jgi:AbrB family looped-hinge helix DNA binding protein
MITTVRVQEKGQVTIPRDIRRLLKLKKGDLVTFISTENGVLIKTLDLAADDLLAGWKQAEFASNGKVNWQHYTF